MPKHNQEIVHATSPDAVEKFTREMRIANFNPKEMSEWIQNSDLQDSKQWDQFVNSVCLGLCNRKTDVDKFLLFAIPFYGKRAEWIKIGQALGTPELWVPELWKKDSNFLDLARAGFKDAARAIMDMGDMGGDWVIPCDRKTALEMAELYLLLSEMDTKTSKEVIKPQLESIMNLVKTRLDSLIHTNIGPFTPHSPEMEEGEIAHPPPPSHIAQEETN